MLFRRTHNPEVEGLNPSAATKKPAAVRVFLFSPFHSPHELAPNRSRAIFDGSAATN
jgi:hypothetical protein